MNACPKAKPLAGRMMCPCHGLDRTENGTRGSKAKATARRVNGSRSGPLILAHNERAATKDSDVDLMLEGLVRTLTILSHNTKGAA